MRTLFLAWQDPLGRRWFPVGSLEYFDGLYSFVYTKGAEQARVEAGFQTLPSFPELHTVYVSEELFPLFSNRMLPRSRPEYREYLQWLGVTETNNDPMAILARSGGRRVTDNLEVFACPEKNEQGDYEIHFLVHGLSHMPGSSADRALQLEPGEPLLALRDFQNPKDPDAIALRTAERCERDMYLIGYCPRYLGADFLQLLKCDCLAKISVERVNPPPAPVQFRVVCKAVIRWPEGFVPFSSEEYEPLVAVGVVTPQVSLPSRHY
ncbi:MAG: HIRAN domain-containing protein [Bryobacteraceae bacterium]